MPLDRSGRVTGTLRLNVAAADNAKAPTAASFSSSPAARASRACASVARVAARLAPVLSAYRLVMVDQRGTGGTAIQCPQLQAEVGTSDIAVPTAAAVASVRRTARPDPRALLDRRDTVADLDDAAAGARRRDLDDRRRLLRDLRRGALCDRPPEDVRALVLDSVLPHADPQADDALYLTGLQATGRVLRAACADLGCGFDPADDLAWVVRHGVDPVKLWDAIVTYEFVDPEYQRMLDAIHEARQGDSDCARTRWSRSIHQAGAAPPELFSSGLHAATLCADLRFPWSSTTPVGRRRPALLARSAEARAGQRRLAVHARDRRAQRLRQDLHDLAGDAGRAGAAVGV